MNGLSGMIYISPSLFVLSIFEDVRHLQVADGVQPCSSTRIDIACIAAVE